MTETYDSRNTTVYWGNKQMTKREQRILQRVRKTIKEHKSGKNRLITEAHFLKDYYPVGYKFVYQGNNTAITNAGFDVGDEFEVIDADTWNQLKNAGRKSIESIELVGKSGKGDDSKVKYLKSIGKGGKKTVIIKATGSSTSYGSTFNRSRNSGDPSATEWEALIAAGYNQVIRNSKRLSAEDKKNTTVQKYWDTYGFYARGIAEDLIKKLGRGKLTDSLVRIGSGNYSIQPGWTGKKGTPKTDVAGGEKLRISLKMKSGTGAGQLISGSSDEIVSTIQAAAKLIGRDSKRSKALKDSISQIQTNFVKFKSEENSKELTKLVNDIESGKVDKKSLPKEQRNLLKAYTQAKASMEGLTAILNEKLFNNIEFKSAFCFEAATGMDKFGDKSLARANFLVVFSPEDRSISDVKYLPNVDSPDVTKLATQTQFFCGFKSAGSSLFIALRDKQLSQVKVEGSELETEQDIKSMNEIVREILGQNKGGPTYESLCEYGRKDENSQLNEWETVLNFLTTLKSAKSKLSKKLIEWGNDVLEKIVKAVAGALEKIKSLGEMMFAKLLEFFGMEIANVDATLPYEDMIQE
jgi:hypothetical protein